MVRNAARDGVIIYDASPSETFYKSCGLRVAEDVVIINVPQTSLWLSYLFPFGDVGDFT